MDKNCLPEVSNALQQEAKGRSRLLQELIADVTPDIRALGIAGNHLDDNHIRWWLVPKSIDYIIENTKSGCSFYEPPKRANGESWGFVGYEVDGQPKRIVMGHNGNGSKGNHFWAYKYIDYSMWDQCGEMAWEGIMLMGECLRDHRRVTDFSNSEKRLWLDIDGKHAHANEDGEIIPDILVMTDKQLKEIHQFLREHKNWDLLMQNALDAYQKIEEIFKKCSHKVLHNNWGYYIKAEMFAMRMMAVHDLVENGFLQLPTDPKKSTLGMYMVLK